MDREEERGGRKRVTKRGRYGQRGGKRGQKKGDKKREIWTERGKMNTRRERRTGK